MSLLDERIWENSTAVRLLRVFFITVSNVVILSVIWKNGLHSFVIYKTSVHREKSCFQVVRFPTFPDSPFSRFPFGFPVVLVEIAYQTANSTTWHSKVLGSILTSISFEYSKVAVGSRGVSSPYITKSGEIRAEGHDSVEDDEAVSVYKKQFISAHMITSHKQIQTYRTNLKWNQKNEYISI